jgi:hypothetical protein
MCACSERPDLSDLEVAVEAEEGVEFFEELQVIAVREAPVDQDLSLRGGHFDTAFVDVDFGLPAAYASSLLLAAVDQDCDRYADDAGNGADDADGLDDVDGVE